MNRLFELSNKLGFNNIQLVQDEADKRKLQIKHTFLIEMLIKLWNDLPQVAVDLPAVESFKSSSYVFLEVSSSWKGVKAFLWPIQKGRSDDLSIFWSG